MKVSHVVDKFLHWCRPPCRSPATVRHYTSRLRPFRERFGDRELHELLPLDIAEYLDSVNEGKAPDTRRSNIIVWERLQNWAIEMGVLEKAITKKIEKPRGRRRDRIPTADETRRILQEAAPDFRLLYTALRQCGARPGELARAQIADIDRERGAIVLTEHKTADKTGRPRVIVIGGPFRATIAEAIGDRTEGAIFLRASGRPWTTNAIGATFRRIRRKLDLPEDLVPYLARHEFATRVVQTVGVYHAKDLLGHTNVNTTERYTHLQLDDLRSAQEAAAEMDEPPAAAA